MIEFPAKNWKYAAMLSIGFLAAVGISAGVPQASAHINSNVAHMLEHIYNFVDGIEAKTNALPSDPADQSEVEGAIDDAVEDIGGTKSVRFDVIVNPADGDSEEVTLIAAETGKTFSGQISVRLNPNDPNNHERIFCHTIGGNVVIIAEGNTFTAVNGTFACSELTISFVDVSGSGDVGPMSITGVVQYTTSSDVTDIEIGT